MDSEDDPELSDIAKPCSSTFLAGMAAAELEIEAFYDTHPVLRGGTEAWTGKFVEALSKFTQFSDSVPTSLLVFRNMLLSKDDFNDGYRLRYMNELIKWNRRLYKDDCYGL